MSRYFAVRSESQTLLPSDKMKVLLPLLGVVVRAQQCSSGVLDLTLTPGSTGEDVTRATYGKVWAEISTWNAKFEDRDFFLRYAYTETNYGIVQHHHVQQIWSIHEAQFNTTKTVALKSQVASKFNVDWDNLEYDELTIPTYSALALFLYLELLNEFPIPYSIDAQAAIYESITHHTVDGFKEGADELDQITEDQCKNNALDIVFVVDESGSIGTPNFQLIREFLEDYADSVNIAADATRIAIRPYSSSTYLYFSLNDYKTKNIINEIKNMPYNGGNTNTAGALDAALTDFGSDRPESVKIMVTITDGASNSASATAAAAKRVKDDPRGIQSYAIGVAGAKMDELEAIASSKNHVEMLTGWADFEPITKNLLSKICEGEIENNNGGDTQVGGSAGTPGKIILKIGMTGKDNFDFMGSAPLTFFYHRSNPQPGPAAYEDSINVTDATTNQWHNYNVGSGHTFVYLSAYNYKPNNALVSLRINSGGSSGPIVPDPVLCPPNSHCVGGTCECFPQYSLDANTGDCVFDRCANVDCFNGYQCAPATGSCFCPADHLEHDGSCYEAACPDSAVQVHENVFGYAMGELSSPWREHGVLYPNNFDCTFEYETIRANGSCYEVLLEDDFGVEASANCQSDRLEIHSVMNADQVNMDHSASRPAGAAVMCGDACVAEGGWVGKICGDKLKIRFKSDHIVEDIGWRLKWVLRPKEECDCLCNRP